MSNIEFLIHDVRSEEGFFLVAGIVNQGNIYVGLSFTSVRSDASEKNPITLTVAKIVAYRHEIGELPKGMSGELHLVGEGEDLLKKHSMLLA